MFNSQYALPLIFIRTWSARRCCGRDAQVPRDLPQSRTRKQSVHDRGLAAHKSRTGIGSVRRQSAVAFRPWQLPRQWAVREQATETAVRRLVLCKAFLAIAAVCLDSAACHRGWLLGFCVRKTCPARDQFELVNTRPNLWFRSDG
jgi:hypothetical protein